MRERQPVVSEVLVLRKEQDRTFLDVSPEAADLSPGRSVAKAPWKLAELTEGREGPSGRITLPDCTSPG